MNAALDPVLKALSRLQEHVTGLDDKIAALDDKVIGIQRRQDVSDAKAKNAQCGRNDPLVRVPLTNGTFLDEYPPTISHLLVSGNENLHDGGRHTWNRHKSAVILAAFREDSGNDTDGEDGATSPRRRLKVAKVLGVTKTQLNFAQLSL